MGTRKTLRKVHTAEDRWTVVRREPPGELERTAPRRPVSGSRRGAVLESTAKRPPGECLYCETSDMRATMRTVVPWKNTGLVTWTTRAAAVFSRTR